LKGLILAGGFATRLRPLSCSKPKLLFPLLGTPLIEYMTEWLERGNVRDVILAVNHLSDKLRIEVAARRMENRLVLSVEATPLGTGGPLRLAAPMIADMEPVVVVNGDVVTDIGIDDLIHAHLESGAEATIAVFSVRDTRPFGLVTLGSHDQIMGFEEKSQKGQGPGWINAGVYVLNPSVIKIIPEGRAVSLEREIFPALAGRMQLRAWKHTGFWYDIGKIKDYVTANMELLEQPDHLHPKTGKLISNEVGVGGPSYVGNDCVIEKNAKVGPHVILSPKVRVKSGAIIRDTIVFEETSIGENCRVEGSVIGEGTTIGKSVRIGKGSVIAGEVVIPDEAVVNPGSIILN
jgi:mannose-1-phosphate guanylyltransferase